MVVELPVIFKFPITVDEAFEMKPWEVRRPALEIVVEAVWPTERIFAVKEPPKRLVEVPDVPVKVERVVRPFETVRVPVKLAAEEMVWELMRPEVIGPRVAAPAFRAVAKRFVEEAVVEKKLVVVAFVAVALPVMLKFPITVDEAVEMKPWEVKRPAESMVVVAVWPTRRTLALNTDAKRLVEVALVVVERVIELKI